MGCRGAIFKAPRPSRRVSRVLYPLFQGAVAIRLSLLLPEGFKRPTREIIGRAALSAPIRDPAPNSTFWPCTRRGFPYPSVTRRVCELLPHNFTIACPPKFDGRQLCIFCGTFLGIAPTGGYPASSLYSARTFLALKEQSATTQSAARFYIINLT
jgi:hypothetical protein